ncbi:hypothetical protein EDD95_8061 [Streptomyces sp. CEV 2-1]|uniref:hypothetical protein n=1 Tax=Streptomyces sp. CEV 2-1 TaxID=2485153 RepID=UPI000F4814C1|nr:hypothetical protein [Streptomyces sp. CEV 2-1]ROQ65207.1 hypothetical protein EDD95_8061 [Streptomyces sp. CEV 2-1]
MKDVMVLAGAIDDVDQLTQKATGVLTNSVMLFMVIAAVVVTWAKTKSVVSAFVAALGGAALWFVVLNAAMFRDSVGEDITPSSGTAKSAGPGYAVVRVIDPTPGGQW